MELPSILFVAFYREYHWSYKRKGIRSSFNNDSNDEEVYDVIREAYKTISILQKV